MASARDASRDAARSGRAGPYDRTARPLPGVNSTPTSGTRGGTLDRSNTSPFLLRVCFQIGGHLGLEAFQVRSKETVDNELQVYAWPWTTLCELAMLVRGVTPEARSTNAILNFRLIYPDKAGRNVMTELGTVMSSTRGPDDNKPLSASKFQTGDLIVMAICA